jgi:hypothetical protein
MSNSDKPSDGKTTDKKGVDPSVWIALIGGLVTIIVALLGFPPLITWLQSTPTPTETLILLPTDTSTPLILPAITNTSDFSSFTPSATEIISTLSVVTETPSLPIGMHVRLYADKTTGKAPLTIKLDARDSFLRAPGGEIYGCRGGACTYTWEVYTGGQRIGKPVNNSTGTFQYTFGKKGLYFITVVACRGAGSSDCNGSGVQIEAR